MSSFEGKVAVITGAGSGIGRALALDLAARGAKLALSDIDADGLAETVRAVEVLGAEVKAGRLNVAERQEVLAYADDVVAHFGTVHQVYNNAGIAHNGNVEDSDFKDIERIMDVDFWGVVNGTKAFLPHVIASGDGHIVNISSLFGLIAVPGQSAYNAAKFAVRGFTEALRGDAGGRAPGEGDVCASRRHQDRGRAQCDRLRRRGCADVRGILRQVPGAAFTGDGRGDDRRRGGEGRARVVIGWEAKALDVLSRVTGSGYQRVMATAVRRFFPWANKR